MSTFSMVDWLKNYDALVQENQLLKDECNALKDQLARLNTRLEIREQQLTEHNKHETMDDQAKRRKVFAQRVKWMRNQGFTLKYIASELNVGTDTVKHSLAWADWPPADNPLAQLELPIRVYNALFRAGVRTIPQLVEAVQSGHCFQFRNFGEGSYTSVLLALNRCGISIDKDNDL